MCIIIDNSVAIFIMAILLFYGIINNISLLMAINGVLLLVVVAIIIINDVLWLA